jgi:hypothetical protein
LFELHSIVRDDSHVGNLLRMNHMWLGKESGLRPKRSTVELTNGNFQETVKPSSRSVVFGAMPES